MRRVTMAEAAQVLGISKEAVRKRIQRGTLRSEMGEDGRRYVYLDSGGDDDHSTDVHSDPRDELIATLKEQLEAERNAHAETRRIAYTLAQRIPELEPPLEPRDAPDMADDVSGSEASSSDTEQPRASWWRRFFGIE